MPNQPGRTGSDSRFRPTKKNWHKSRYGTIEIALNKMKDNGVSEFRIEDAAARIKQFPATTIKGILQFTNGIEYRRIDRTYRFTGDQVWVDYSGRGVSDESN